jgi:hypothetical protein
VSKALNDDFELVCGIVLADLGLMDRTQYRSEKQGEQEIGGLDYEAARFLPFSCFSNDIDYFLGRNIRFD